MGAVDFEHIRQGQTAEAAFDALTAADAHERGHGPYSGGIGQKMGDGFVMLTREPVSVEQAMQMKRQAFGDEGEEGLEYEYTDTYYRRPARATFRPEKWGPTGCIELLPEGSEERRTVELQLPVHWSYDTPLAKKIEAVTDKVKLKSGERIADVSGTLMTFERRATIEVPKLSAVTRYYIVRKGGYGGVGDTAGYASQAEARAAMTAYLKRPQQRNDGRSVFGELAEPETLEIVGRIRRSDGSGLVFGRSEIVKPKSQVTVTIAKRLPVPPRKDGDPRTFLFFGLASS
jgi:hypothetical protein